MDINENNIDNIDQKRVSLYNLPFTSMKLSTSLNNNQPYKIVKEYFDPKYYIVTEEELFKADPGYFFGEWALIYNQPRSASVIALEDSIFITLDEKIFSKTFLKCLTMTEHRKKKFILENLFPFNLYNDRRNSLYKDLIPKSYVRNQIIFSEGDNADSIYLIYSGTFILEKYYRNRLFRFKSVEKGSILGLESLYETEEENKIYKCTLKLSSLNEFGTVVICRISKLVPYILDKMKTEFKNMYSIYIKSNEEFYEKNINYEKKILVKINKKKMYSYEELEKYIEDCNLIDKEEKLKNKKIKFNTLEQKKLTKRPKIPKNDLNIKIDNINNINNNNNKDEFNKIRRNMKKSRTIKLIKNNKKSDVLYTEKRCNKKRCFIFKRMNTIMIGRNKINLNKENNDQIITSNENNQNNNNINKSLDENDKNNKIKIKLKKYNINRYMKYLLSYTYKPSIIDGIKLKTKNIKKNIIKKEESKNFLNKTFSKNKKTNKKLILRNKQNEENYDDNYTDEFTNFTELPKINLKKNFRFDSGEYKLPLMTQIIN